MRPTLTTLKPELINRILNEAKRVMAEIGMEIRGSELKQRLLDHGIKTDASGRRFLFPEDVIDKALQDAPGSFSSSLIAMVMFTRKLAVTMCTTYLRRVD